MGDIADEHVDQMLADGTYGWTYRPSKPPRCRFCGSVSVKWRLDGDYWRLYDAKRVHPGNRMPVHNCRTPKPSPEGFTDV